MDKFRGKEVNLREEICNVLSLRKHEATDLSHFVTLCLWRKVFLRESKLLAYKVIRSLDQMQEIWKAVYGIFRPVPEPII